jgi:hypothetical protein
MADEIAVAFNNVGTISGVAGGPNIISSPTNVQFGPDGRLYVTEHRGMINVFTVEVQEGKYVATAVEEIDKVLKIQNHNDDGSLFSPTGQERQITGMLVKGTAATRYFMYPPAMLARGRRSRRTSTPTPAS